MSESLFNIPIEPGVPLFLNDIVPLPIHFSNISANLFAPNGANGPYDASKNPMSAYTYLKNKADMIEKSAQQRPLVRLADKNLNVVGELTGEMSMEFEELMVDSGQGKYIVRFDNWLVDYIVNLTRIEEDLHLLVDPNPTNPTWRTRWGGKIHTINVMRHADGTSTVEMLAISNREHAKHLLIAANPIFAPEVQLPRMWILPGPIRTVLFITFFINLARLFMPGLSFITNVFNPVSWFDPLSVNSLKNFSPFEWPIQVAFVNPLLDQSRWTVLGSTWTDWHSASADLLKDAGCMLRAYTYLKEDHDSPHEELTSLLHLNKFTKRLDGLVTPARNCVVFRIED